MNNKRDKKKHTTLIFKKQEGCETVYVNPKRYDTPEGEVMKVVKLSNEDGSLYGYEITYREGHFYLGGRTETVTELPTDIILVEEQ
jgi:hypothetical protein